MPATLHWNREWLDSNNVRSYPLAAEASKLDASGAFRIPNDFLLGLYLPVHAGLDIEPGRFFLQRLSVFGPGIRVTVAYHNGTDEPVPVASGIVPRTTHEEYDTYEMPGQGDFEDTRGTMVIGSLEGLNDLPAGDYLFDFDAGRLEADAIQPMVQYVSALVVVNGTDRSARLAGDIELEAGNNVRITVTDADTSRPKIRIDAIDGEGLSQDCVCDETEGPPIRTISGIPPGPDGNFNLLVGDCISAEPVTAGLRIANTCVKPCCDCPELNALIADQQILKSEVTTYKGFVNRLIPEVETMSSVVLGSRLNDEGCIPCSLEEESTGGRGG